MIYRMSLQGAALPRATFFMSFQAYTPHLAGRTFVVKDLYEIKGRRTGFGNPSWLKDQTPATSHAPAVQLLLDAGARCIGVTCMDELAYSLNGENAHYGTPLGFAPDRIPGKPRARCPGQLQGSVARGLPPPGMNAQAAAPRDPPQQSCTALPT